MIPIEDRALAVFTEAWRLLPSVKHKAFLSGVGLADLQARHGSYDPQTGRLTINARLFRGENPQSIPMIDIAANTPPRYFPCCSRALHTALHETYHAIGQGTGLDTTPEWLALSGWVQAPDDPEGTGRYWESRPGWTMGPSEWRYATGGTFFIRSYSSKTPMEDFADTATHVTLGWLDMLLGPHHYKANGQAKLAYLRKHVWGEKGVKAVHAARARWQAHITRG